MGQVEHDELAIEPLVSKIRMISLGPEAALTYQGRVRGSYALHVLWRPNGTPGKILEAPKFDP